MVAINGRLKPDCMVKFIFTFINNNLQFQAGVVILTN